MRQKVIWKQNHVKLTTIDMFLNRDILTQKQINLGINDAQYTLKKRICKKEVNR